MENSGSSSLMSAWWKMETTCIQGVVCAVDIVNFKERFRLRVDKTDASPTTMVQRALEWNKDGTVFISLKNGLRDNEEMPVPLDRVIFEECASFGGSFSAKSVRIVTPWREVVSSESLMAREHVVRDAPCIISPNSYTAPPSGIHRDFKWWSDLKTMFWTKNGNKVRRLIVTITQRQWNTEEEAATCQPFQYSMHVWDKDVLFPWIPKNKNWKAVILQHHIPFYAVCCRDFMGGLSKLKLLAIQWDVRGYLEQNHDQLVISQEEAQERCGCENVVIPMMNDGKLMGISHIVPSGPGWQYYDLGHTCVIAMRIKDSDDVVTKRLKTEKE